MQSNNGASEVITANNEFTNYKEHVNATFLHNKLEHMPSPHFILYERRISALLMRPF